LVVGIDADLEGPRACHVTGSIIVGFINREGYGTALHPLIFERDRELAKKGGKGFRGLALWSG